MQKLVGVERSDFRFAYCDNRYGFGDGIKHFEGVTCLLAWPTGMMLDYCCDVADAESVLQAKNVLAKIDFEEFSKEADGDALAHVVGR